MLPFPYGIPLLEWCKTLPLTEAFLLHLPWLISLLLSCCKDTFSIFNLIRSLHYIFFCSMEYVISRSATDSYSSICLVIDLIYCIETPLKSLVLHSIVQRPLNIRM